VAKRLQDGFPLASFQLLDVTQAGSLLNPPQKIFPFLKRPFFFFPKISLPADFFIDPPISPLSTIPFLTTLLFVTSPLHYEVVFVALVSFACEW